MVKKKRDSFFGIPFLPSTIFLILILLLFVFPPAVKNPITGKVTSRIKLIKTEYGPNEKIDGEINIKFFSGDLIPSMTNVELTVSGKNYSTNLILSLPQAIALSSTPWKGNFTYGRFNNVNGPSPTGEGYGFSACANESIAGSVYISGLRGYAIQQPQPLTPDLTVTDIYTVSSPGIQQQPSPQPPTRLYTKIKNLGGQSGAFTVVGCWYEYSKPSLAVTGVSGGVSPGQIPSNCFYVKQIQQMGAGQEIILDMGSWNVEGKTVQVIVDYFNNVHETNENNNQMIKSFMIPQQCIDPDDLDYYTKGTCTDSEGYHTDYCSPDAENVLIEYHCGSLTPSIIAAVPLCNAIQYVCPNGCYDGACKKVTPTPECKDSDGGKNYGEAGTCSEYKNGVLVESYKDYCLELGGEPGEPNLAEYYCTGNNLIKWDFCGNCTNVSCKYVGSFSEGWYAKCPGGERLISYELCSLKEDKFKPVCLYQGTRSEGWYTPDVCDKEEFTCYYGCLGSKCKISNYSCYDWNNVYKISLDNLNIKAPEKNGVYNLSISLTYSGSGGIAPIVLYSDTKEFNVTSHKACQNYQCVVIAGSGPNQCTDDSDCRPTGGGGGGGGGGGACNEEWKYHEWSECDPVTKKRQRECYDARNCGTTYAKPSSCIKVGDKYYQTESCVPGCQENWQCSEWSYCDEKTLEQSSVCEDLNRCNPENYTYLQLRDCCIEEWDCKWGPCENGIQEKICEDLNNCGTEFTKPAYETRSCGKVIAWWTWLIIVLVLLGIIIAVLVGTGRIPLLKKKVKTEEYPELREYIKKAREQGMSKEQIRTKLVGIGWPENIVDDALK